MLLRHVGEKLRRDVALDQALQRPGIDEAVGLRPELEDVGRRDPGIGLLEEPIVARPAKAKGAIRAPVETPVTTAKSGRVPVAIQPLRMPALNAPFSPPPESTSQGSPETLAEARAASYSASELAKKRASGMPPMRATALSSAVKTMRSNVFCGGAVRCAGFRASASGAARRSGGKSGGERRRASGT